VNLSACRARLQSNEKLRLVYEECELSHAARAFLKVAESMAQKTKSRYLYSRAVSIVFATLNLARTISRKAETRSFGTPRGCG